MALDVVETATALVALVAGGTTVYDSVLLCDDVAPTYPVRDWQYLNGLKTPPAAPISSAQLTFAKPPVGRYALRFGIRPSYRARVVADGATHYWRLGEASGTTAADSVGTSHGTISGGVTLGQAGALGDGDKAMAFNGTTGKIAAPEVINGVTNLTVELWVRLGSLTVPPNGLRMAVCLGFAQSYIAWNASLNKWYYVLFVNGGQVTLTSVGVDLNWHHLVMTFDGSDVRAFNNGILGTASTALGTVANSGSFLIGNYPAAGYEWDGLIDDVAIYPSALTAEQIAAHYALAPFPASSASQPVLYTHQPFEMRPELSGYRARVIADRPIGYWRLGETTGTVARDEVGTAHGTISTGVTLGQPGALGDGDKAMARAAYDTVYTVPPGQAAIDAIQTALTLECWLYKTAIGPEYAATWYKGAAGTAVSTFAFYQFGAAAGGSAGVCGLLASPNGVWGWITPSVVVPLNGWHHLVATYDAVAGGHLYLDGVAVGGVYGGQGPLPSSPGYSVGHEVSGGTTLDECAIYSYALTAAQVAAHYALRTAPAPPAVPLLEMEFLGKNQGWTIVRDWHRASGLVLHRGLPGTGALDLVADIGTLMFTLDNSARNSAGTLGYYSPDHGSKRTGFYLNIGVRVRIGTIARFTGVISAIDPVPGLFGPRTVAVEATDWMGIADRTRLANLPVLVNKRGDEVLTTLLASLPPAAQPAGVEIDLSPDTFPYTLDRTRDEQTVLRDELYRLCTSGLSRIFLRGNGTLVYESRGRRASVAVNVDTFTDSHGFAAAHDRTAVVNRAQATIHPRIPGTVDLTMYALPQPVPITAGVPLTILGPWTDPANPQVRVGAVSLVALVRGTDYTANAAADGTGADLTAAMTVVAGLSGNATSFTVTVPSGGFITKLQQRGKPLYDYGAVVLEWSDPASVAQFGLTTQPIDMPYAANAAVALEVAQFIVYNGAFPLTSVSGFTRIVDLANPSDVSRSISRGISDRIGITDPVTGVAKPFFINSIDETITDGRILTQWALVPADTTSYWTLEVTGYTELDLTTLLAFGQILGHTDTPHDDVHNDAAHADAAHADSHTDLAHADQAHGDAAAHGDSGHADVSHADGAHSDVSAVNWHTDTPHTDTPHDDVHGDIPHDDIEHSDAHDDGPYFNFTDHGDSYADLFWWNGEVGYYGRHLDAVSHPAPGSPQGNPYGQTHMDLAHGDHHSDANPSVPAHWDIADHADLAHGDSHADSHVDSAHWDYNASVPHGDVPFQSAHGDTAHSDVAHADLAHSDVAHADAPGHTDAPHADTPHTDVAHQDIMHSDTPHADSHTDFHGDLN